MFIKDTQNASYESILGNTNKLAILFRKKTLISITVCYMYT